MQTVFAIGRWMPIHLGHKQFLVNLARKYDRLVIGIGSCYENGTPRNCIPAVEREKLLRKIMKKENISNVIIIPVQDRGSFDEWFADIIRICEKYSVTHFCTGNKEDILNVMKEKGLKLDAKLINPEEDGDFPYHATDIRNAIINGELERLDTMIPSEIKDMVLNQIKREIIMASRGMGQEFVPGRQTVDVVFVVKNRSNGKNYVLVGKRSDEKIDFPGVWAIPGCGICEFESPVDAASRCLLEETGISFDITDNSVEPADVVITSLGSVAAGLDFIGIYASHDERINGSRGGGSQCFGIHIEEDIEKVRSVLNSMRDMTELEFVDVDEIHKMTLAFDQKRMVFDALCRFNIAFDNGELIEMFDVVGNSCGQGVPRSKAHEDGILHGAAHTYIYKRDDGDLYILLQRRSLNKDSFPGRLDTSSAGHVEYGADFSGTAVKELKEELGIVVGEEELVLLFDQIISSKNVFHGKDFIDNEFNRIYALERDVDIAKLSFQASEVSEALWMSAEGILAELDRPESELCMNKAEMRRVISILSEN
ncbi:MAG: NUDIX domain-containing protein [Ruminococcaceae bacterium]|nr:NUDIX domain-containing protein [Oscillospiraceae bacterium]